MNWRLCLAQISVTHIVQLRLCHLLLAVFRNSQIRKLKPWIIHISVCLEINFRLIFYYNSISCLLIQNTCDLYLLLWHFISPLHNRISSTGLKNRPSEFIVPSLSPYLLKECLCVFAELMMMILSPWRQTEASTFYFWTVIERWLQSAVFRCSPLLSSDYFSD